MKKLKNSIVAVFAALLGVWAGVVVDNNSSIMISNGKIYVVMSVVIVIVAGLLLFLLNLDKKISKLEKEI